MAKQCYTIYDKLSKFNQMRKVSWIWSVSIFVLFSCNKVGELDQNDEEFVPTDVLVKTNASYTIDKVFDFINSFDHDVEYIKRGKYTSSLPSDSLTYVLNYLNAKSYTNDGNTWFVTGYLHYQTQIITIFPRLFDINNIENQTDWLQSMEILQLSEQLDRETSGYVIYFHVPIGTEKEWVEIFETYDFVKWVELNYIAEFVTWP